MRRTWSAMALAIVGVLMGSVLAATTSASSAAAEPDGPGYQAPKVGQCRNLTPSDVQKASNDDRVVPCSARHNDRVIAVATIPAGEDWAHVTDDFIERTCMNALHQVADASWRHLARSSYTYTYYGPTAAQQAHGATWLRCDLNIFTQTGLRPLPHRLALPDTLPKALQGCLYVHRDATADSRQSCASKHNFRSVASIALPSSSYSGYWPTVRFALKHCPAVDRRNAYWTWTDDSERSIGDRLLTCYQRVPMAAEPGSARVGSQTFVLQPDLDDEEYAGPPADQRDVVTDLPYTPRSLLPRRAAISTDHGVITVTARFRAIHARSTTRGRFVYDDRVEFTLLGEGVDDLDTSSPDYRIHRGETKVIRCATGHGTLRLSADSTTVRATIPTACFPPRYRLAYELSLQQVVIGHLERHPHGIQHGWYADSGWSLTQPGWI